MIAVNGDTETIKGSREWAGFEEIKNVRTRFYFFSHDYHVFCSCLAVSQNIRMGWFHRDPRGASSTSKTYENRCPTRIHFPCSEARREIKKCQAAPYAKEYKNSLGMVVFDLIFLVTSKGIQTPLQVGAAFLFALRISLIDFEPYDKFLEGT